MSQATALQVEFEERGRSASCPVVDMHAHGGPWYGIRFPHADVAGMLKDMDRCGVRLAVCASHSSLFDPPRGNEWMRRVVEEHPDRFRGWWTIHPHYCENLEAELAALPGRREFVGVKLHPSWHQYPLEGERYRAVWEWAEATGQPVLTHTWGGNPQCAPGNVRQVAERHPRATILMGHSCSGEFAEAIALAREFPGLHLELTGVVEYGGLIEWMVEEAGAEKVIFGTDMPWFDPHYGIGCVVWSRISEEARHAILHGNAERILRESGQEA